MKKTNMISGSNNSKRAKATEGRSEVIVCYGSFEQLTGDKAAAAIVLAKQGDTQVRRSAFFDPGIPGRVKRIIAEEDALSPCPLCTSTMGKVWRDDHKFVVECMTCKFETAPDADYAIAIANWERSPR